MYASNVFFMLFVTCWLKKFHKIMMGNVKYGNIKQNQEIITSLFLSDILSTKSEK